ncbi:hypothetical protein AAJCM20276_15710 [Acetobacter aceti]|uniref:Uncharacterized protein n=1 Tax=Acetobacter aceti TaxID=435 RepID=A0A6S6PDK8_ACEAC|nr:hypothetical protein [Acetobacter aceti]BCI66947.1 hypothetical protein AAJCM20276_15710 [Acetobacter aceti]
MDLVIMGVNLLCSFPNSLQTQVSFLEPEDGCFDVDIGLERMSASAVSGDAFYTDASRKMALISGFSSTGYRQ